MIQFQEVLFNDLPDADTAAATETEAGSSSWLRVGEAVEVLMTDSELYGSRYAARVLALEEGRSRARTLTLPLTSTPPLTSTLRLTSTLTPPLARSIFLTSPLTLPLARSIPLTSPLTLPLARSIPLTSPLTLPLARSISRAARVRRVLRGRGGHGAPQGVGVLLYPTPAAARRARALVS